MPSIHHDFQRTDRNVGNVADNLFYSNELHDVINRSFHGFGWVGEPMSASSERLTFFKERIMIEIPHTNPVLNTHQRFMQHMAFYVGDVIDVGIEILPTKNMQEAMLSGVGYYEGELYNLVRQGRGSPAVPLVLIGVSP